MLDRTYQALLALLIVCAATFAVAPHSHAQSALNAKRIALVIGNSTYQSVTEPHQPEVTTPPTSPPSSSPCKFDVLLAPTPTTPR